MTRSLGIVLALGLGGCMTVPTAPTPIAPEGAAGAFPDSPSTTVGPVPDDWWKLYDDPQLNDLVAASLLANADLRVALANLEGGRALLRQARAARLPQTTVESGATVDGTAAQPSASSNVSTTDYDLAVTVSWDADLFGRLKSSAMAARADLEAQAALADGLRVAVAADTALAYVDLCGATIGGRIAREQLRVQERSAVILSQQLRAGEISPLEVSQGAGLLETTRAASPGFEAAASNARQRLATLQGRPPSAAPSMAVACDRFPSLRIKAPIGDGRALLLRRPDVREAERRLAAAAARVGVSRADLYPRVNLGGAVGLLTGGLVATASPLISWAFPNQGPARARLAQAKATERAALASWDVAVLRALREVEAALATYEAETSRRGALEQARSQAALSARRAAARVRLGDAPSLVQLDAERTSMQALLSHAQSELAVAQAEVALFRALGGGWRNGPQPLR